MADPGPSLNIHLLTFNTARNPVSPSTLAPCLFTGLPSSIILPDIIAISLQEVAPIAYGFLGGSFIAPYFSQVTKSVAEARSLRIQELGWNHASQYTHILTRHVGMTALMLFALEPLVDRIKWVQTAGTGVGLWSMGNKGAVGARLAFGLGDNENEHLELTFVAAHLAPFEDQVKRRNEDFANIVRNLGFTDDATLPAGRAWALAEDEDNDDSEMDPLLALARAPSHPTGLYDTVGPVFFFGDLNYRTASRGPTESDVQDYPVPSDSEDHPNHFRHFLKRDQLTQERRANRVFHHFSEATPITFPPTYKYHHTDTDPASDSDETWNFAPHRFPSWCDRILYIPASAVTVHSYTDLPIQRTSDHRPVAISVTVKAVQGVAKTDPPFPLNAAFANERASARTREVVTGVLAYLAVTREGNAVLVGVLAGAVGGWWLLKSLV